jgi:FMN phosphatase YigB (HAD superfamily)
MKKFSVVSVDMFRTLAELENVERTVWREILKDRYTPELAAECTERASNDMFNYIPEDGFVTVKAIFAACFADLFRKSGIEYSPDEAADLWSKRHSLCEPYSDAVPFLKAAGEKYTVCLATDADDDMLDTLGRMYDFDYIFSSEKLRTYKARADGSFFTAIVDHYGVSPETILHIGDGRFEMVSAGAAGLSTCWLNRTGKKWRHEYKPDYEARSLTEAARILGVTVEG